MCVSQRAGRYEQAGAGPIAAPCNRSTGRALFF